MHEFLGSVKEVLPSMLQKMLDLITCVSHNQSTEKLKLILKEEEKNGSGNCNKMRHPWKQNTKYNLPMILFSFHINEHPPYVHGRL